MQNMQNTQQDQELKTKQDKNTLVQSDKKKKSKITAIVVISASEIAKVIPNFNYELFSSNNALNDALFNLGMDVTKPIEVQETIQHRNRFGEMVMCDRWVGDERTDATWIKSGYASNEAIDKSKGNSLLNDLYRMKGMYGRD